jgi:arylsulfatase A-like enzyme
MDHIFFALAQSLQELITSIDHFSSESSSWCDLAVYNGMGAAADSLFGNVTQSMKDRGMWDETLVLMTSDNGGVQCHRPVLLFQR